MRKRKFYRPPRWVRFGLRLPAELHRAIEVAARASGRSLNTEMVERLRGGFDATSPWPTAQDRPALPVGGPCKTRSFTA
jgi:hypothetical protein